MTVHLDQRSNVDANGGLTLATRRAYSIVGILNLVWSRLGFILTSELSPDLADIKFDLNAIDRDSYACCRKFRVQISAGFCANILDSGL